MNRTNRRLAGRLVLVLVSTVLMTVRPASAGGTFDNKGETAWGQYHKQLLDYLYPGGADKGIVIQPLAIAQRAGWDTQSAEYNMFLKQDLANAVPAWTSLYIPSAGRTVPDEYMAFLDQLNKSMLKSSAAPNQAVLDKIDNERQMIRAKLEGLKRVEDAKWKQYVTSTSGPELLTKAKWEEAFGYSADRNLYEQQLQAAAGAYLIEVNSVGGDLKEIGRAIAALGSPTAQAPLPSSEELIPLGRDYWDTYYRTSIEGDIFQFKSEVDKVTWTFNASQGSTSTFSSSWNVGVSVGWFPFFNASGSVEHQDISTKAETQTTDISVHFDNIKAMKITRGQWFKGGLLNQFLDRLPPAFWGPAGRLNLVPVQVVLAHGLKIDITTGAETRDYIYNRHSTSGGGGICIGPFHFGGSGGSTTTYENSAFTKTDTGLHIEDTSGRAIVLAVISERKSDLLPSGTPIGPSYLESLKGREVDAKALLDAVISAPDAPVDMGLRPTSRTGK